VEFTNDGTADNPLLWLYSLVYGMSLIAILLFSAVRSVLLMKVNISTLLVFCLSEKAAKISTNIPSKSSRTFCTFLSLILLLYLNEDSSMIAAVGVSSRQQ